MATLRTPRRRLPARVYWVRRGLVAVLALLLVVGISRLIGTGSDAPAAVDKATQTSGERTSGEPTSPAATGAAVGPVAPGKKLLRQQAKLTQSLPAPDGPCGEDEITVRPSVAKAAAGGEIAIELQLFGTRPACTFAVSPDSLVVKVASGADGIWTSQDCKKSITKGSVTVYSGTPAIVPVIWNGRRSEPGCGPGTSWAMPGFYHVLAAAQGSTPSDTQFEVTLPDHPVVTRTIKPKPQKKGQPNAQSASPSPKAPPKP
ncbi:MAG: hypothetical protein ABIN79_11370 [Marmoricola sp.]